MKQQTRKPEVPWALAWLFDVIVFVERGVSVAALVGCGDADDVRQVWVEGAVRVWSDERPYCSVAPLDSPMGHDWAPFRGDVEQCSRCKTQRRSVPGNLQDRFQEHRRLGDRIWTPGVPPYCKAKRRTQ